jgi:heme/copper-type cytochrome/quinol oxidase subunit 2
VPIKAVINYWVVKVGNIFQAQLNRFCMLIFRIIIFFLVIVLIIMVYILYRRSLVRYFGHSKTVVETAAFIIRAVALLIMSFPSIYLLYLRGCQVQPGLTVKIVGRQWYWSFEVADLIEEPVLMYMLSLDDLKVGNHLYMDVDNRLILPRGVTVQFNVTSRDVIHSFAIPTLGIKVDATPGLLTVVHANLVKVGTHYGQCREICGMNHRFIPFCLEVTTIQGFKWWSLVEMVNQ